MGYGLNSGYENLGELGEFILGIAAVLGGIILITSIISLVLFILSGVGILKMSQKLQIRHGWLAFIPFLSGFALGRVAQKYVKQNGKKSAPFGIIILILSIVNSVAVCVNLVFTVMNVFAEFSAVLGYTEYFEDAAAMALTSSAVSVIALTISTVYSVIFYVALWRVFALFNNANATTYLVLSIFFGFLQPIFLFVCRKNDPKVTFEERIGVPYGFTAMPKQELFVGKAPETEAEENKAEAINTENE